MQSNQRGSEYEEAEERERRYRTETGGGDSADDRQMERETVGATDGDWNMSGWANCLTGGFGAAADGWSV